MTSFFAPKIDDMDRRIEVLRNQHEKELEQIKIQIMVDARKQAEKEDRQAGFQGAGKTDRRRISKALEEGRMFDRNPAHAALR